MDRVFFCSLSPLPIHVYMYICIYIGLYRIIEMISLIDKIGYRGYYFFSKYIDINNVVVTISIVTYKGVIGRINDISFVTVVFPENRREEIYLYLL